MGEFDIRWDASDIYVPKVPCGPMVCNFPSPDFYPWRSKWTCPECFMTYIRARRVKDRRWRSWYAPGGYWRLPMWARWARG